MLYMYKGSQSTYLKRIVSLDISPRVSTECFIVYYSKFAKDHFFYSVLHLCICNKYKIDLKELNIISASCTWQIDNLSTQ